MVAASVIDCFAPDSISGDASIRPELDAVVVRILEAVGIRANGVLSDAARVESVRHHRPPGGLHRGRSQLRERGYERALRRRRVRSSGERHQDARTQSADGRR